MHAPKASVNKTSEDSSENEIPSDKVEKKPVTRAAGISSERALNHLVPGVYDMHDMENEEVSILKMGGGIIFLQMRSDLRHIFGTFSC